MNTRSGGVLGLGLLGLAALAAAGPARAQDDAKPRKAAPVVTIRRLADRFRIEIDGALFTEYLYEGYPNPILYPVHGAGGVPMTRNFPMRKGTKSEATDHPHHRSLWFTHGEINGHDFWAGAGRIVQTAATSRQDGGTAVLTTHDRYVVGKETICTDTRTIAFHADAAGRCIDFDITIHASEGDLLFGDTKEGSMAMRIAPQLRIKGKVAAGHIRNSEGVKDKRAWGKRAQWIDAYGPLGDATVGVAIFDHPDNHGHPCRWHARDYGLLAANPWGVHHFEGAPKHTGDMKLSKGASIRLRYRFLFHAGTTEQAGIAAQYARFRSEPAAKPATAVKAPAAKDG